MSIFEIKKKKTNSILFTTLFFVLTVASYTIGGLLGNNILFFVPAIISSICVLYFIMRYMSCTAQMAKRINHLIFTEMDPALLDQELPEQIKALGKGAAANSIGCYYEALRLTLIGNFDEARGRLSKVSLKPPFLEMEMKRIEALCNLRTGRIEQAESICLLFESKYPNIGHLVQDGGDTHATALYYLKRKDFAKARAFLYGAMKQPLNNFTLMNICYDIARLEEEQGNVIESIENYKQAAAIGPKTWLGQEAAKRLAALENQPSAN